MKIARIYLRVSTDEQDLTRQGYVEDTCKMLSQGLSPGADPLCELADEAS